MGYLIGSLPMGVIVARLTGGTDPRTVGSGRTGGTNMLRAGGWGRAVTVAVLDLSKGAVPILIAGWLDAPIEVRESPIHGVGVFATRDIPAGAIPTSDTYNRFSRFRLGPNLSPALELTGLVVNGEVEDHYLEFTGFANQPPTIAVVRQ